MDSTESNPIQATLRAQGHHLHHQEEQLNQLKQEIVGMSYCQENLFSAVTEQIVQLSNQFQGLSSAAHILSCSFCSVSFSITY